jgi:hypothetical protein
MSPTDAAASRFLTVKECLDRLPIRMSLLERQTCYTFADDWHPPTGVTAATPMITSPLTWPAARSER